MKNFMKWISIFSFVFSMEGFGQTQTPPQAPPSKPVAGKKLEFEDQSVNALDPDYGKLDLTSMKDRSNGGGRLYPVRKDFKREQQETIKNWGIVE